MANENARKGAVTQFEKERFDVGEVLVRKEVVDQLDQGFMDECLHRHCCGVWGLVDEVDRMRNERAIQAEPRLVRSVFLDSNGRRVMFTTVLDSGTTYVIALAD